MSEFGQFDQQGFTTDYLGDGVRYRLPRRQLARARHLGWVVVGTGLILSLFMIAWMSGPVLGGLIDLKKGGGIGWFSIAFGCFGLIGLIPGLGLILGGFAIVCNRTRCQVEVRGGTIAVKERFFLARLKRKRETSGIRQLRVADASEQAGPNQEHNTRIWLGDSDTALLAETASQNRFLIAAAYPRELLVGLAEELVPRLEASVNIQSATIEREPVDVDGSELAPRKIEVVEGPIEPDELPLVPDQPADSVATIERRDDGITIEIPPAGIWKGSKGLFVFALLWNALISLFLVVGVLAALGFIEVEGDGPEWLALVILMPFVAVGVGMTVAAVNMGRRHATIATADDLVMIVRHSIFGKTTREWSASEIIEIRCGNSGMEVNDVPINELQVIPSDGKKFGCLGQLENGELIWIAAELNQALAIERRSGRDELDPDFVNRDASGQATPAPNSRITLARSINGLRIDVPPQGLFKYAGTLIFGVIFVAAGMGVACGISWDALDDGFRQGDLSELLIALTFLLGFGGIGGAVLLAGLVAGRRRFRLTIEHDELTLLRRGPIWRKTFRWQRDDLESVDVINNGTQVNNRSLYQLFIRSRKGASVGIMTGHDSADLELVATAVQETLGLTNHQPAPV